MEQGRNRVVVWSVESLFSKALRQALDGREVTVGAPGLVPPEVADLLVWRVDRDLDQEHLAAVAAVVPTLVVGDESSLILAVEAGCAGFLPKDATLEEIIGAVDTIIAGGAAVPPALLGRVLRHLVDRRRRGRAREGSLAGLTARQRQVFQLAGEGMRREEIARRLYISPATVRTHLEAVYRKLGVHSHPELVALAASIGEEEVEE